MKLQYIYLMMFLGTGLLSSCFGKNTKSSLRSDERITVDVGVETTEMRSGMFLMLIRKMTKSQLM